MIVACTHTQAKLKGKKLKLTKEKPIWNFVVSVAKLWTLERVEERGSLARKEQA